MKKIINILIILIFTNVLFAQNNRLQNGTFDEGEDYEGECDGYDIFNKNVDDWQSRCSNRGKFKKRWNAIKIWRSCRKIPETDCPGQNCHSPDWGSLGYNSSEKCASIGSWELLQQKFKYSNKLEEDKHYLLSFDFYLQEWGWNYYLDENDWLKFYLAKKKVKYKKNGYVSNAWPCKGYDCFWDATLTPEGYMQYEDGILQDIVLIGQVQIMNYNLSEWYHIEIFFNGPSNDINDYNWFMFDLHSNFYEAYPSIDNISIIEVDYCNSDPCSPTDGDISPTSPYQYPDATSPIYVGGLENVASATDIKIYSPTDAIVGELPDIYSINGIFNPIVWEGSYPFPTAYRWIMTLHNDCGDYEYDKQFIILDEIIIQPPPQTIYNNEEQTPLPCCDVQPDIFLQNTTLSGVGELKYVAQNNIYINNVTIEDEVGLVTFQAGNEIEITGEFESNDNFEMLIEECDGQNNGKNYNIDIPTDTIITDTLQINNIKSLSNSNTNSAPSKIDKHKINITISPNPSNGLFLFTITPASTTIQNFIIYNNLGSLIYENKNIFSNNFYIDLSYEKSGLYFIKIITLQGTYSKKLIFY